MAETAARQRSRFMAAAFIVVLAVVGYFVFTSGSIGNTATLLTGTGAHRISVEVANTDDTRATGLMNRESLPEDHGMLFDFGTSRDVAMWMKNTLIPLDMLFIRADGTIARISRNTTPLSLQSIPSGEPVRYVLEINGGAARTYGAEVGDRLHHPIIGTGSKLSP